MKFTVQIKAIADALKKCSLAQTSRGTLPILSCLKIEAGDGSLTISGTDLDRWMTCTVPATVSNKGSIAISARMITAIMSGSGEATFEADAKNKTKIQIGASRFNIAGLAASEFPDPRIEDGGKVFRVKSDELTRATSAVKWAASTDITRYVLNGILAEFTDGELRFVATNGTMLSLTSLDFEGEPTQDFILPNETVPLIEAIAESGNVEFTVRNNSVTASSASGSVTSKMIDGAYPNYRQVIPRDGFKTRATVTCDEFIGAMDRVAVVIKDRSFGSIFEFSDGKVAISAQADDSAETELETDVDGPPLRICWRSQLLKLPLRSWGCERVEIAMIDELSPSLITHDRNQFVIMPMRTNQ